MDTSRLFKMSEYLVSELFNKNRILSQKGTETGTEGIRFDSEGVSNQSDAQRHFRASFTRVYIAYLLTHAILRQGYAYLFWNAAQGVLKKRE